MDGSPLLTDLYQLTMAYAYWKSGRAFISKPRLRVITFLK